MHLKHTISPVVQICSIMTFVFIMFLFPHPSFAKSQTGIMVPLYMPPGDEAWNEVIQAKMAHRTVPILVIVNPDNGPGHDPAHDYASGIQNLKSHGISVAGYTYTEYATRNETLIKQEISNYKNWYKIDGIFFDQMSNAIKNEKYYANLTKYSKSLGLYTIGNAGIDVPASYVGTVDNIVIHDNETLPPISYLRGWHENYNKSNFSTLSFGVNHLSKWFVNNAKNYVGYMELTDSDLPNPWNTLPSYFADMVSSLDDVQQNGPTSTVVITIRSVDESGNEFRNVWSELHLPKGTTINQGYTPISYAVTYGKQYMVNATSWQNVVFDHWSDGNRNPYRVIIPTHDTTLTAYYTGITGSSITKTITIKTEDLSGKMISGMRTELHLSNSYTTSSGFGPKSYPVTAGQTYIAVALGRNGTVFDHWDDGSKDPHRTITPTHDTILIAYYRK